MKANAIIPLFTFTPKVEKNNDGAKDNDVDLVIPLQQ